VRKCAVTEHAVDIKLELFRYGELFSFYTTTSSSSSAAQRLETCKSVVYQLPTINAASSSNARRERDRAERAITTRLSRGLHYYSGYRLRVTVIVARPLYRAQRTRNMKRQFAVSGRLDHPCMQPANYMHVPPHSRPRAYRDTHAHAGTPAGPQTPEYIYGAILDIHHYLYSPSGDDKQKAGNALEIITNPPLAHLTIPHRHKLENNRGQMGGPPGGGGRTFAWR